MRKSLIIILLAALPMVLKGQTVEVEGSYLRQLQERDSVLIADQLQYGFRLDGVPASSFRGGRIPSSETLGAEGWRERKG